MKNYIQYCAVTKGRAAAGKSFIVIILRKRKVTPDDAGETQSLVREAFFENTLEGSLPSSGPDRGVPES